MAAPTEYVDAIYPVVEILSDIHGRGYSRNRVFSDWLDLMLTTLQHDDEAYLEVCNQYDDEDIKQFAAAFGEVNLPRGQAPRLPASSTQFGIHSLSVRCERRERGLNRRFLSVSDLDHPGPIFRYERLKTPMLHAESLCNSRTYVQLDCPAHPIFI